jgi:enoyl-CoA hydratase
VDYSGYRNLKVERRDDGVLLLTIDRPAVYNAVDEQLHHDLGRIWLDIGADPETRIAVITGSGKAFSSGGDLAMERRLMGSFPAVQRTMQEARDLVLNVVNCEKPIISAINGTAVGAGLARALMADISVIGEDVKFTDGHLRVGLTAGDHAVMIWPLLCGMAKAKYYLLTSDFIDGREAERIGLVSKCVPNAKVLDEALAIAARLAAGPQTALRRTKRAINHWLRSAQPAFEASLALEMLDFFGPDVVEGFDAIEQRRQPRFDSDGE